MSHRKFLHSHRVTYAECTLGNHIYYARYLDLLEAARGEFFRSLGMTFQQLQNDDTIFPVIEARLRYKAAARYDDVLQIEVWLAELARVRVDFAYRIFNQHQTLLVEANTLHACTATNEKPKRVPEELAAQLKPYVAETPEAK
jgi:acyl-CoA thioester hydrolase